MLLLLAGCGGGVALAMRDGHLATVKRRQGQILSLPWCIEKIVQDLITFSPQQFCFLTTPAPFVLLSCKDYRGLDSSCFSCFQRGTKTKTCVRNLLFHAKLQGMLVLCSLHYASAHTACMTTLRLVLKSKEKSEANLIAVVLAKITQLFSNLKTAPIHGVKHSLISRLPAGGQ